MMSLSVPFREVILLFFSNSLNCINPATQSLRIRMVWETMMFRQPKKVLYQNLIVRSLFSS